MSLIILVFFFLKLPSATLIDHEIQNTGHTILFFLLSILCLKSYRLIFLHKPDFDAYLSVFIFLNTTSICIELIQINMLRDADTIDLLRNLFGIIILFGLDYFLRKKNLTQGIVNSKKEFSIFILSSLAAILSILPISTLQLAYHVRHDAFPTIVDFNSIFFKYFYNTYNATIYAKTYRSEGTSPPSFNLVEFKQAKLSSISIIEPIPNWLGYNSICFNIYTPPFSKKLKLTLRINDSAHNYEQSDRYNHVLIVNTSIEKHCVKLNKIENSPKNRTMDLTKITNIQLFQSQHNNTTQFYLSRFWLE